MVVLNTMPGAGLIQGAVHPVPIRRGWLFIATGGVLLWRAAAFRWPSALVPIPEDLRLPLLLLGVLFLLCGVWAYWARPDRWTTVFLVYALGGGVHWGGAIGAPQAGLELSFLFVYLGLSALGEAALLHLALIYPKNGPLAQRWRGALYAPAALALLVAAVAGFLPQAILRTMAGSLFLVASLLGLVAGFLFLVRLFTVERAVRRAARLPHIVGGLVVGGGLELLGTTGVLPGHPGAWSLLLGLIPISLAIALVSQSLETSNA